MVAIYCVNNWFAIDGVCYVTLCSTWIFHEQRWIHVVSWIGKVGVIKWKHFTRYWPFVRGIHRSRLNSHHRGQWRGTVMFPLILAWTKVCASNRDTGDLRGHSAHYNVTVMGSPPYCRKLAITRNYLGFQQCLAKFIELYFVGNSSFVLTISLSGDKDGTIDNVSLMATLRILSRSAYNFTIYHIDLRETRPHYRVIFKLTTWNFKIIIFEFIPNIVIFSISCKTVHGRWHQWWLINIGSGNGLVSSGNKPLTETVLVQLYVVIWCQLSTILYSLRPSDAYMRR